MSNPIGSGGPSRSEIDFASKILQKDPKFDLTENADQALKGSFGKRFAARKAILSKGGAWFSGARAFLGGLFNTSKTRFEGLKACAGQVRTGVNVIKTQQLKARQADHNK